METVSYQGAVAPSRSYSVASGAVGIVVYEWGSASAPPLFLVHGGSDFARTFDVFAPLIAAKGWRVVAWDHRGHGDSDRTALYGWDADIRDAISVIESVTNAPAPVIAHSKGGAQMIHLADAQPYKFSHLVNIDGLPYRRPTPDVSDHDRTRMLAGDIEQWLDLRRKVAGATRKPGTLDDLARRRGKMNPRLTHEWLRYLVTVGARHDEDGWRWKIDPAIRFGGFGPWRPEWTAVRLPGLGMPFLGLLASEAEEMGWGTLEGHIRPHLPRDGRLEVMHGMGHFCHIEQPQLVADLALGLIGEPR